MATKKRETGDKSQEEAGRYREGGGPQGRGQPRPEGGAAAASRSRWRRRNGRPLTLLYVAVALLLLAWVRGCVTVAPRSELDNPYAYDVKKLGLDEKTILKAFNLHRGRWWNYYARGSWLLAAGHYDTALKDFNDAIDQRTRDRRDARTYGMHFMDYFPQRESGLAYCFLAERATDMSRKKELFGKAIAHLETSIDQAPSSKAKFYLKRATAGFWRTTQEDTTPPVVWIKNEEIDRWADVPTLYISGYAATLHVQASDGQSRVGEVWVGGEKPERRLFVESAEEDFNQPVAVTVDPSHRTKTVEVRAVDLAGNESLPAAVRLVVDTVPPTGTLRVREDNAALSRGRVSVDLAAADDYGLRSVRVGDDPYNQRDCSGQRLWEGRFSVEPGDRSLAVEIVDRAGNVTAMQVALETERTPARVPRGEYLLVSNASLGYGWTSWRFPLDTGLRVSDSTAHPASPPLSGVRRLSLSLVAESGRGTASDEEGAPELILLELNEPNTLVRTSSSRYLLQGQVRNATNLDRIIIRVDNEELEAGEVPRQGDPRQRQHAMFSAWVPLPECNQPRSIAVEARLVRQPSLHSRPNLRVERVPDLVWDPRSVYSVVLLPLEDDYCLGKECSKADRADAWVLNALQDYRELGAEDGQRHQRFDCRALSTWDAFQVLQILDTYYRDPHTGARGPGMSRERETGADRMIALGRQASDLARACHKDLAVYGLVADEGEMFDLKLGFTSAESKGRPLLADKWIDIYGVDRESAHYVAGLISKLEAKIPRVRGQVEGIVEPRTIEVNRGAKDSVFANMSFVLYDVSASNTDPSSARVCETRATSVSERRLNAQIPATKWPTVLRRWKNVHVISK
jgi:hypothetical protein